MNLEKKLGSAKQEMNKIINTKVFSRGNNLIYELDMSSRQLRMMKDNVYLLEKNLKDKIRIYFDKDLSDCRKQLVEQKKKFSEHQIGMTAAKNNILANVVMTLDQDMKNRFNSGKGFADESAHKHDASYVANELMNNYSHLLVKHKSGGPKGAAPASDFGGMKQLDPILTFQEMEKMKETEKEARDEVLALHDFNRK